MKKDYFKNLPSEIITNILSRLPLRATAISKCICRSWFHLLENRDFINSHLSKSAPVLAVLMPEGDSNRFTLFELEDEPELELELESHAHHYHQLTKFDFPHRVTIEGSSNGLLFLRESRVDVDALYVCNPITHEYIELHYCEGLANLHPQGFTCGFGVTKITSKHKLVCIFPKTDHCYVYTLGSGLWRLVEAATASFEYDFCMFAAFVDGNLHWLLSDSDGTRLISCFDLETERFTTFSIPPLQGTSVEYIQSLSSLKDCLCLCDDTSEDEIIIWLMKEYGVEESWTKEYVVSVNPEFDRDGYVFVYPIKVFADGDILMVWDERLLFYYSNKTKSTQEFGMFDDGDDYISSMLLTPSFLSLKSFGVENVFSF